MSKRPADDMEDFDEWDACDGTLSCECGCMDFLDDGENECTHCGGDGYEDCDDPLSCMKRHARGGLCPCSACGGSGLAKDQRIW